MQARRGRGVKGKRSERAIAHAITARVHNKIISGISVALTKPQPTN